MNERGKQEGIVKGVGRNEGNVSTKLEQSEL